MLSTGIVGLALRQPRIGDSDYGTERILTVLPATTINLHAFRRLTVTKGTYQGAFVSLDGGTLWRLMPDGMQTRTFEYLYEGQAVLLRTQTGGDVDGIYADLL